MKQFCRRTPAFPLLRQSDFFPLVRSGLLVFFSFLLVGRLLALHPSLRLKKKGWAEEDGRKMVFLFVLRILLSSLCLQILDFRFLLLLRFGEMKW